MLDVKRLADASRGLWLQVVESHSLRGFVATKDLHHQMPALKRE